MTPTEFTRRVEAEWERLRDGPGTVPPEEIARLAAQFTDPPYRELARPSLAHRAALADSRPFSQWAARNVAAHKRTGYAIVTLSLKKTGVPPGDVTAAQMDAIADARRPLQLRRAARHARAEPGAGRRAAGRPPRPVDAAEGAGARHAEHRAADRHRLLPRRGLLLARQRAGRSRSRRRSSAASTTWTSSTTWASSSSTCRAA